VDRRTGGQPHRASADDPRGAARDARSWVRANRQHDLGHGEGAVSDDGALDGGSQRPRRLLQGGLPGGGGRQRHDHNLLPERFDTGRTHALARRDAGQKGISYEQAIEEIRDSIAAKRLGRPEEYGAACAYLCSVQAGYISGQNLSLDGGTYPGVF
jgi:enoyl-ACP reductase-like protein